MASLPREGKKNSRTIVITQGKDATIVVQGKLVYVTATLACKQTFKISLAWTTLTCHSSHS